MNFLGIDIGSTTIKLYLTNESDECLYRTYQRHYSDVQANLKRMIKEMMDELGDMPIQAAMTGSGGLALSQALNIDFVQEVIACTSTVEKYIPETDVVIELGGEDAKITYFEGTLEQRMNGSCAGGTGAFIDQMASLLQTDAAGLNELAKHHETIYPIASRCGVFAKTDVQPLINEGAAKEDIAASIFQAVVNQTISGLACGKPIRGMVAFLGGPLYFLSSLRERFIETLGLTDEHVIFPSDPQLFVAMGACIHARESKSNLMLSQMYERLNTMKHLEIDQNDILPVLFKDEDELTAFRNAHNQNQVEQRSLETYSGDAYLGIDVGSTTSKIVLISDQAELLYTYYGSNNGNPLELVRKIMMDIYDRLPSDVTIRKAGVTGYGESLIKAALKVDLGEVETIAHFKAAQYFMPNVDFIIDIGGQDMKAIKIKDGAIEEILLNEACSSGCGSFIETFASSLKMSVEDFAKEALLAKHPIDLGSRCTVFMNSKVKQAQKEGASIADISAGLSYSVIKNALYKVIKLRSPESMGKNVIVQGGTFYNEAILRAFEKETGVIPFRPTISGLMGAFGIALMARDTCQDQRVTSLLSPRELEHLAYAKTFRHCSKCTNNCALTITTFNDGREFVSGNRCERGANLPLKVHDMPNGFDYKYRRVFDYQPLLPSVAPRGTIGIPRVLNMYDNYPFWHTFFTSLGFRVVLSPRSSKKIYEMGMETIPSESVCYPAKLVHGHIESLIKRGVNAIFYPSVIYERKEDPNSNNHYNCPIVQSYPEVVKNNVEAIKQVKYIQPFITLNNKQKVFDTMKEALKEYHISEDYLHKAIELAYSELDHYKDDIYKEGQLILDYMEKHHCQGIVLAGRPYHIDPEINHGLADLITAEGLAVLTEEMVSSQHAVERPLRVVDQWMYHTRLYNAAAFITTHKDLELIQLTSFGCGLDAVTADQVQEILKAKNKIYTLIKIDEGSNLGAIRIRIRSLKATMDERRQQPIDKPAASYVTKPVSFTKEMKDNYTILCPQMSPIHFQFIEPAARNAGYNLVVLPEEGKKDIEEGLRYVNNDACYPSILTIGQMMNALKSGRYDPNKTALIMTQTGGGCRATNYIAFIRKALKDAGMSQVPVISLNVSGLESNPGFKITYKLAKGIAFAAVYGDLLMRVLYRVRPYEKEKGSANALYQKWVTKIKQNIDGLSYRTFKKNIYAIVKDFDELPLLDIKKPRVGLVGEILVKFSEEANNHIVDIVENEGAEAVMPDLIDFFMYCFYSNNFNHQYLETDKKSKRNSNLGIKAIEFIRKDMRKALRASKRFDEPGHIDDLAAKANKVVSVGNQTGEGWFLTAEMIELIETGAPNIVCMQPFGCLPNHVTGKGVIKALRATYPNSNIVAIDYDPGVSEVNQLNRIKLMLSTAFKSLKKED